MTTNIMTINGHRAVIEFSQDIGNFRGSFLGLNGGADFCSDTVEGLRSEEEISLKVFFEACAEEGIEPIKSFSGKFQVRLPEELHGRAAEAAAARGISLNQFVQRAIEGEIAA